MLKVLLLIVLYNSATGELQGVWQQGGNLPSFETVEQCEDVVRKEVSKFQVPTGMSLKAQCIEPGVDNHIASGVRT